MRWISDVWFRLRALLAPGRMERDLEEEMAFHLEMETGKHLRDGLTPEERAGIASGGRGFTFLRPLARSVRVA